MDNKPIKNKKTSLFEDTRRLYSEYENNEYSREDIIQIIQNFDSIMQKNSTISVEYDINKAVFAMETYFNYAVVENQLEFDSSISYENLLFNFSVNLDSLGRINSEVLREEFSGFINQIMVEIGNRYIQFSDLFVSEITENTITFSLFIPRYTPISFVPRKKFLVTEIIKSNSVIQNDGCSSFWGYRVLRHQTEYNIYAHTRKSVHGIRINLYADWENNIAVQALRCYFPRRYSDDTTMNINPINLHDTVIPETLEYFYYFLENSVYPNNPRSTVFDYDPVYDWDYTHFSLRTGNNDDVTHFLLLRMFLIGDYLEIFPPNDMLCAVLNNLHFKY